MAEPARGRLPRVIVADFDHPDALDETVVHDPAGRPWLVCTSDTFYGLDTADPGFVDDAAARAGRYETQVFFTARAGIRGFPTGHGERYGGRSDALTGHRRWCLKVRAGDVCPDLAPEEPI